MAPASIPVASALQLSLGLSENLGKGRLLGGGARLNSEPENFSKSSSETTEVILLPVEDDHNTLETSLGRSFGSGPNGFIEVGIERCNVDLDSNSTLGIDEGFDFDFFGVTEWSLPLLVLGGHERPRFRGGGDWW